MPVCRRIDAMKPPTEKPSEGGMRFFTPDLYLRFNSPDDDEADRADEAWESAVRDYQRHLRGLRDRVPGPVRKLAELCLHDWEVLAVHQEIEPSFPSPLWSAVAVVSLRRQDQVAVLVYALWDRIREHPAAPAWPFSGERKHWLYDELDVAADPRGPFLHRVLLSDGTVLEIPFASSFVHTFAVPPPGAAPARKTA